MASEQIPSSSPYKPLTWWQILLLVILWPVGLIFFLRWMWLRARWPKGVKTMATIFTVFVMLFGLLITFAISSPRPPQTTAAEPAESPMASATPATTAAATTEPPASPTAIATGSSSVATPAQTPAPTPSEPTMNILTIKRYNLSVKYPAGWKVLEVDGGKTGAQIIDPKSDAVMWVEVWMGDDRLGTPREELKGTVENIIGNGGQVTMQRSEDQVFEARGVVDGQVRHYFGFQGADRDYTIDWTYTASQADTLDPKVALSVQSFTAD